MEISGAELHCEAVVTDAVSLEKGTVGNLPYFLFQN